MAVELCTDSSTSSRGISPRISFSYDLNQSDLVPTEPHIPLSQSLLDIEFDFCVSRRSHDQDSFLADELFANGIILPIQIKRKNLPMKSKSPSSSFSSLRPPLAPQPPPPCGAHRAETESQIETEEKQGSSSNTSSNSKSSFWRFKRSKSYNCGSIYGRGLCPLPLLSRSKSTGSTTSAKRSLISKDEAHHHQNNGGFKQNSHKNLNSSYYQKPPLKKSYGSSFNSGVVLNVPTGKLLGLGSIFSSAKDKGKKK